LAITLSGAEAATAAGSRGDGALMIAKKQFSVSFFFSRKSTCHSVSQTSRSPSTKLININSVWSVVFILRRARACHESGLTVVTSCQRL
jgi:hypothetical protein